MEENKCVTTCDIAAKMRYMCSQGMARPFLIMDREHTGNRETDGAAEFFGSGIISPTHGDNPAKNIDDIVCIIYSITEERSVVIHLTMKTLSIQGEEYEITDTSGTSPAYKIASLFVAQHIWMYK